MKALTSGELLEVWERGQGQNLARRAMLLLAAAWPEISPQALAELSIGQRDSYLLNLREWLFGPQLISLAVCPNCAERLELNFSVSDIRIRSEALQNSLSLERDGYSLKFRLPTSLDLVALTDRQDLDTTRQTILERCLLETSYDGEATELQELPAEIIEAVANEMARADPQADVQLALACSACGHEWQNSFDIVSFLWDELNAWAYRLLREVHLLASAYSWGEADILALSPWRRQLYLEMIGQ